MVSEVYSADEGEDEHGGIMDCSLGRRAVTTGRVVVFQAISPALDPLPSITTSAEPDGSDGHNEEWRK